MILGELYVTLHRLSYMRCCQGEMECQTEDGKHLAEAGRNGRALHNVKASSMLCLLDNWNLRNSNCVPKTMSEVNATGMTSSYPGVCSEGRLYPHAHFSRKIRAKYRRRQTLYSSHTRAISGPQL